MPSPNDMPWTQSVPWTIITVLLIWAVIQFAVAIRGAIVGTLFVDDVQRTRQFVSMHSSISGALSAFAIAIKVIFL